MRTLPDLTSFAQAEGLALVLQFGSSVNGAVHSESDCDIAILPRRLDVEREGIERRLVEFLRRCDLDFLWLPYASALAKARVAASAKLLYEDRSDRFFRFQQEAALGKSEARVWADSDQRFVRRTLERNWTVDREFVSRKLAQLALYLAQLEEILPADEESFSNDFRIHRVAERQIELLIECAGKVNTELAQALARIPPSDYYSSFHSLAATGWADREVCARLANLAGLRNRLVHQYEDVRLPLLFQACQDSLPDWRAYLAALLHRLGADSTSV